MRRALGKHPDGAFRAAITTRSAADPEGEAHPRKGAPRNEPCLVCGRKPPPAHHLRFAQPSALGLKVSDEYRVPLSNIHHDSLHQTGEERARWARHNSNPEDCRAVMGRLASAECQRCSVLIVADIRCRQLATKR